MPRFSQLFFYNFDDEEMAQGAGQKLDGSVSWRAARTYVRSGIRLQSTCGISDIWYNYIEANWDSYEVQSSLPCPPPKAPCHPQPYINPPTSSLLVEIFQWKDLHHQFLVPKRPRITHSSLPPSSPDHTVSSKVLMDASDDLEAYASQVVCQDNNDSISAFTEKEASPNNSPLLESFSPSQGEGAHNPAQEGVAIEGPAAEQFKEWPLMSSFNLPLSKIMGEVEDIPEVLGIMTAEVVPSSVEEEQELWLPSQVDPPSPAGQISKDEGVSVGRPQNEELSQEGKQKHKFAILDANVKYRLSYNSTLSFKIPEGQGVVQTSRE